MSLTEEIPTSLDLQAYYRKIVLLSNFSSRGFQVTLSRSSNYKKMHWASGSHQWWFCFGTLWLELQCCASSWIKPCLPQWKGLCQKSTRVGHLSLVNEDCQREIVVVDDLMRWTNAKQKWLYTNHKGRERMIPYQKQCGLTHKIQFWWI